MRDNNARMVSRKVLLGMVGLGLFMAAGFRLQLKSERPFINAKGKA
jgi:hypothetical protein